MYRLALGLLLAVPCLALEYTAKDVTGGVLAWSALSSSWSPVQTGDNLSGESLIYIEQGGVLSLGSPSQAKLIYSVSPVEPPLLFRLTGQPFRKVAFHPMKEAPDQTARSAPERAQALSLLDAWKRWFSGREQAQGGPDEAPLPVSDKVIQILAPSDELIVLTDRFPRPLAVAWRTELSAGTEFELSIRKKGSRPVAFATTQEHVYSLWLSAPGTYLIRVGTKDGAHTSSEVKVHLSTAAPQVASKAQLRRQREQVLFPKPGQFYLADRFPVRVPFKWDDGAGRFVFTLRQGGRIVAIRKTERSSFEWAFESPGDYTWQVDQDGGPTLIQTQALRVRPSGASPDALIRQLLAKGTGSISLP